MIYIWMVKNCILIFINQKKNDFIELGGELIVHSKRVIF